MLQSAIRCRRHAFRGNLRVVDLRGTVDGSASSIFENHEIFRARILPRVIESVRPLVLPKLREENERQKTKSRKKRVKDVVIQDDFEVSIFLTETSTRHTLLSKQKHFRDKAPLVSNSSKLTGTTTAPILVDAVVQEEDDELDLEGIPEITHSDDDAFELNDEMIPSDREMSTGPVGRKRNGDDLNRPHKRVKDDKKKLAMDTNYEGFSIYGRVLCLVVRKRESKVKQAGQAMMEDWITSTQMPQEET